MEFTLRELRILSRLTCYDDQFELTINEIDDDEKKEYIYNNENLKVTIAEWFCDYLSGRIFKKEINGKYIYFFLESSEDLYLGEFEKTINKVKFSSKEEFYNNINKIFEENNYDPEKDYYTYFNDDYDE